MRVPKILFQRDERVVDCPPSSYQTEPRGERPHILGAVSDAEIERGGRVNLHPRVYASLAVLRKSKVASHKRLDPGRRDLPLMRYPHPQIRRQIDRLAPQFPHLPQIP